MASIIDKMAAMGPEAEMADLLAEDDALSRERTALQQRIDATWDRQSDIADEIGCLVREQANVAVRQQLTTKLVSVWAKSQQMASLTVALRDADVWPLILLGLTQRGLAPFFRENTVTCVVQLAGYIGAMPSPAPCPCCHQGWVATIQRGSVLRICAECCHVKAQLIPEGVLPAPKPAIAGQGALW